MKEKKDYYVTVKKTAFGEKALVLTKEGHEEYLYSVYKSIQSLIQDLKSLESRIAALEEVSNVKEKKMKEVEKENGETFIEDEVTLRLRFPKKWNTMTKGDIQEILNKYIEDEEWRKPTVKPVAYMTSDMLKGVMRFILEGDLMGAGMILKSLIKVVDDETMKNVQQLVEGK